MSLPSVSLQPYIRQAGEHQRLAYTGGHELAVILDAAAPHAWPVPGRTGHLHLGIS